MKGEINLEDKFCGCLLASALGDAIGEIAFFRTSHAALREELQASTQLRYTDDTAMAIGLAESITRRGSLESRHLGDTFRSNFLREPWRGYASGPPTVFSMVSDLGISYTEAAGRLFGGAGSFGNGAAMRIGPVAAFYYDSPRLYEQVRDGKLTVGVSPSERPSTRRSRLPAFLDGGNAIDAENPVFVGREQELARLRGFLDRCFPSSCFLFFFCFCFCSCSMFSTYFKASINSSSVTSPELSIFSALLRRSPY